MVRRGGVGDIEQFEESQVMTQVDITVGDCVAALVLGDAGGRNYVTWPQGSSRSIQMISNCSKSKRNTRYINTRQAFFDMQSISG